MILDRKVVNKDEEEEITEEVITGDTEIKVTITEIIMQQTHIIMVISTIYLMSFHGFQLNQFRILHRILLFLTFLKDKVLDQLPICHKFITCLPYLQQQLLKLLKQQVQMLSGKRPSSAYRNTSYESPGFSAATDPSRLPLHTGKRIVYYPNLPPIERKSARAWKIPDEIVSRPPKSTTYALEETIRSNHVKQMTNAVQHPDPKINEEYNQNRSKGHITDQAVTHPNYPEMSDTPRVRRKRFIDPSWH
ncbi:MAG: hypothetical protein EZS28_006666 [Streblomastix strix]|uniref:Uncharacterized protein n=1 Tax=Streblomastix strix TaxID=222440 RepID=A0A5J4WRU3_9EUKA|nr:MAG: hypothetical protein EZS28_006666 [Streblomastix strix]